MISLFIDTCSNKLIVGVVDEDNNKILTFYNEKISGDLSTNIFNVITTCIESANISKYDIKKIYSVVGPGSFTGIRIGVTISKVFAWAQKIKVIPLSSLEVLATTHVATDLVIPMIDARRDCVYGAIYDDKLNCLMEDSYISLESLYNNIPKDKSYNFICDDGITYFDDIKMSDVNIIKIINKHKNDEGINPHILNPRYLKMTEAEANLLSKKND